MALTVPTTQRRRRAALVVAMLGFFVVALDAQIVNVALPTIRDHLGGGLSGLQWIATGYTLMFSALQFFSGTLSDRVGSLTFGIIEGGALGFSSTEVLGAFGLACVAATVFIISQARGRHPMVPLDLFRSRTTSAGLSTALVTMAAFYGVVFVQSLYFQQQHGQSAPVTGLLFLPMTGTVATLNPLVARMMQRIGLLPTTVVGIVIMFSGLVGLSVLPLTAPLWAVSLLMVPVGVGGSVTVPPLTALIMNDAPTERAGMISGVLNTSRQMGGSLGVAVFGAVLATHRWFSTERNDDDGLRDAQQRSGDARPRFRGLPGDRSRRV